MAKTPKPKPKSKEQLIFEAGYIAAVCDMAGQKPDAKKMEQAFREWKEENPKETPLEKEWKRLGMPSEVLFEGVINRFVKEPSGKYSLAPSLNLFGLDDSEVEHTDDAEKAARAGGK